MQAAKNLQKLTAGIALGVVAAYVVSIAFAGAYREGEILDVLVSLTLPPLVLFFVYQGSEKRFVFCVASLLISGILFDLSPALGVPRAGLGFALMTVAAIAAPVILDLSFVDMGRQIHIGRPFAHMAQLAFLLALLPLAGWKLAAAHETIVKEDKKLVGQLAAHLSGHGNSLVLDSIDARTRDRAQRRIAIRAEDKTYSLSDADVEQLREERTWRKKVTNRRGTEAEVTKEQEEWMRLILKLQGTAIPDEVVVYSHRGPLTIYEAKVPLVKSGS
jgi:hypothetical protein